MKISRGDLIVSSKPYAYVLSNDWSSTRCAYCFIRSSSLKKCSGCGYAYYCDKPCQKAGWADHKLECNSLKKVHPRIPPPHVLLMARIIRKLKREGPEISEQIGNKSRKFSDLLSHSEEIKSDPHRLEGFVAANFVLSEFLNENERLPVKEVLEIFGKIIINSMSIVDKCLPIGAGLYLGPSIFNHSCEPTLTFVFSGPTLLVRSLVDANHCDVTKMYVNYIDLITTTAIRRNQLKEQYYFTCECSKCSNSNSDYLMVSIRCENESCLHPIIPTDEKCPTCGSIISMERRQQAEDICLLLQIETDKLSSIIISQPEHVLSVLEEPLMKGEKLLHRLNIYLMSAMCEVFEAYYTLQNFEKALKLGTDVLSSIRVYYHDSDYLIWHLERLGRVNLQMGSFKPAIALLSEVLKGLRFFYGKQCIYSDQISRVLSECQRRIGNAKD